jgi:hypothetical protein
LINLSRHLAVVDFAAQLDRAKYRPALFSNRNFGAYTLVA